jgi:Glycosyltransferase family 28 C-terminal domain
MASRKCLSGPKRSRIWHDFTIQAEKLGDRYSEAGIAYQRSVRALLELPHTDRRTILIMGGGEGVGSLSNIADALYVELVQQGIDALVLVICGRNEKLQTKLAERDWNKVLQRWSDAKNRAIGGGGGGGSTSIMSMESCVTATTGCDGVVTGQIRRMLTKSSLGNAIQFPTMGGGDDEDEHENNDEEKKAEMAEASLRIGNSILEPVASVDNSIALVESLEGTKGDVKVVGLGFVSRMAEFMVAADILVSKAGPGTISEAAAVSLPILLTSFLPGQEEGNVDYVVEGGFGAYIKDSDPIGIAEELCLWLKDERKLQTLGKAAKAKGAPYAARDIAKAIGESTLKWMELNEEKAAAAETQKTT